MTRVSSSSPRAFRSLISAATGWSVCLHFLGRAFMRSSPGMVPCVSQPQSNSCTYRTPFSIRRRASRQLLANDPSPGFAPYDSWTSFGSLEMSITSGTAICMRYASSYWLIRVSVSGSPISLSSSSLSCRSASRLRRRLSRSIPLGFETYRIGSPLERHCTPWKTEGRKPLLQRLLPPVGSVPPETRTTKPGRSWLSEPRPQVTHEPIDALPARAEPVYSIISAGAWLNWSVYIERTKHRSSVMEAMFGSSSETHIPDWPCCLNL